MMQSVSAIFPQNFVSCFKLDGKPILPPFLTAEKRAEMVKYRQLAVDREKLKTKISPEPPSEPKESISITETESPSTELANYMLEPTESARSDESGSTTVTESLKTLVSEPEITEKPKKSTLIRSDSFTVETPSRALLESVQSLRETQKTPDNLEVHLNCLSVSPVISQKLTEIVSGADVSVDSESVKGNLEEIEEMQDLLLNYHKLQMEELQLRQEQEIQRLAEQKEKLQRVASSFSVHSDHDSERTVSPTEICTSVSSRAAITPNRNSSCSLRPRHVCFDCPPVIKQRLASLVKGYLTRRLMKTDRVLELRKTIREIREMTLDDTPSNKDNDYFKQMIAKQLESAQNELIWIFESCEVSYRMGLIERQRKVEEAHRGKGLSRDHHTKAKKRLSLATRKSMARKGLNIPRTPTPIPRTKSKPAARRRTEAVVSCSRTPMTLNAKPRNRTRVVVGIRSPRPRNAKLSVRASSANSQGGRSKPWR